LIKAVKVFFVVCLFLFGIAANSYSAPVGLGFDGTEGVYGTWNDYYKGYYSSTEEWSGYYIATISGVADKVPLEENASLYLGETFDGIWAKVDNPSGTSGYLTTTADGDLKSGTWSLADPFELGFYAVKGATDFAFYYVDPYQSHGNWSTIHLLNGGQNQPAISHLGALAESTPVPEPATMLLLGSGLIGLAGMGRKKFFKKN